MRDRSDLTRQPNSWMEPKNWEKPPRAENLISTGGGKNYHNVNQIDTSLVSAHF